MNFIRDIHPNISWFCRFQTTSCFLAPKTVANLSGDRTSQMKRRAKLTISVKILKIGLGWVHPLNITEEQCLRGKNAQVFIDINSCLHWINIPSELRLDAIAIGMDPFAIEPGMLVLVYFSLLHYCTVATQLYLYSTTDPVDTLPFRQSGLARFLYSSQSALLFHVLFTFGIPHQHKLKRYEEQISWKTASDENLGEGRRGSDVGTTKGSGVENKCTEFKYLNSFV